MTTPEGTATVVVVDDEPDIRRVVRLLLQRSGGFDVVGEASDGEEALVVARDLQPDVILLDLMMPKLGGRAALPQLVRDVPEAMIVVLSALDEETEADPTKALGAFGYLEKTSLGEDFADEVRSLLRRFLRALDGETVVAPASPEIA